MRESVSTATHKPFDAKPESLSIWLIFRRRNSFMEFHDLRQGTSIGPGRMLCFSFFCGSHLQDLWELLIKSNCHTSSGTITTSERTDDYEQHPWNFLDIQSFVPEMKLFHKNDTVTLLTSSSTIPTSKSRTYSCSYHMSVTRKTSKYDGKFAGKLIFMHKIINYYKLGESLVTTTVLLLTNQNNRNPNLPPTVLKSCINYAAVRRTFSPDGITAFQHWTIAIGRIHRLEQFSQSVLTLFVSWLCTYYDPGFKIQKWCTKLSASGP